MKRTLFLCMTVGLCFQAIAYANTQVPKQSLFSFVTGRNNSVSPIKEETNQNKSNVKLQDNKVVSTGSSQQAVPISVPKLLKDTDNSINQPNLALVIKEEDRVDEVFINSFRGITSLSELLTVIQSNVESLNAGRMSNDDYNKLLQKKERIADSIAKYKASVGAYDKICYMEKILMDYNTISEISVHFLSDIAKQDINKLQSSLFISEIDSIGNGLTYAFKTSIGNDLKEVINIVRSKIEDYDVNEFIQKLISGLNKIPVELLDAEQYKKIEKILNKLQTPINGNFENKCTVLKDLVESYNELKSIPFRLQKISTESMKNLALKSVEDMFFDKILDVLRIMNEEQLSEDSENDDESMAARNLKKSICQLLGGNFNNKTTYESNIEKFRTTVSLDEKQKLLHESITQFNRTVEYFKKAVASLKANGRRFKSKNMDFINTINEDIYKIFEKISIYDQNIEANGQGADAINIKLPESDLSNKIPDISGSKTESTTSDSVDNTSEIKGSSDGKKEEKGKSSDKSTKKPVLEKDENVQISSNQTVKSDAQKESVPAIVADNSEAKVNSNVKEVKVPTILVDENEDKAVAGNIDKVIFNSDMFDKQVEIDPQIVEEPKAVKAIKKQSTKQNKRKKRKIRSKK